MSKLIKLVGASKKIKLGNDVEMDIKPLSLKHLNLILQMGDETKSSEAMIEVVRITLEESVPDATKEEIDNVSIEHFNDLMEAISDVNNLKKKEK